MSGRSAREPRHERYTCCLLHPTVTDGLSLERTQKLPVTLLHANELVRRFVLRVRGLLTPLSLRGPLCMVLGKGHMPDQKGVARLCKLKSEAAENSPWVNAQCKFTILATLSKTKCTAYRVCSSAVEVVDPGWLWKGNEPVSSATSHTPQAHTSALAATA